MNNFFLFFFLHLILSDQFQDRLFKALDQIKDWLVIEIFILQSTIRFYYHTSKDHTYVHITPYRIMDIRTLVRSIQTSQFNIGRINASCHLNASPFRIPLWVNTVSLLFLIFVSHAKANSKTIMQMAENILCYCILIKQIILSQEISFTMWNLNS